MIGSGHILLCFILSLLPGLAWASGDSGLRLRPALELQECRLLLQAATISPSGMKEWTFGISKSGGTHGGSPIEFREGSHEILVVADGQWLSVLWRYAGKKIAASTFVVGAGDKVSDRVGIPFPGSATEFFNSVFSSFRAFYYAGSLFI
jgi:hypothetical protein